MTAQTETEARVEEERVAQIVAFNALVESGRVVDLCDGCRRYVRVGAAREYAVRSGAIVTLCGLCAPRLDEGKPTVYVGSGAPRQTRDPGRRS